jgi:hypoxanthine phosphoribosyltransferase
MFDRPELEVLIAPEAISARILEMGSEIARDYADLDLAVVAVLKGSFMFLADLVRTIPLDLTVDFLGVSSYGADTISSGVVKITSDLNRPIEGRDVLLVEDIVDTGLTIQYLRENFQTRRPRSMRVCTFLHKPGRTRVEVPIDYTGFTIEDHFVVGYGLDADQLLRNLPYIGRKV